MNRTSDQSNAPFSTTPARAAAEAPPMPPAKPVGTTLDAADAAASRPVTTIEAPPSFGRQMAQLVVIPAVIVLISIGVVTLLGSLVRTPDSLEHLLKRLEQPSGLGRTQMGLQDPRYLDRCRAAQTLATRIPGLTDPQERATVNETLINILNQQVNPGTDLELQTYLLLAIGLLGEDGGLEVVLDRLRSDESRLVEAAVGGVLVWPDVEAARQAVPDLIRVLNQGDVTVRVQAAAALGKLAQPHDEAAIAALAQALNVVGSEGREVAWNAGVALAKLGDPRGVAMVTGLLLNREALAKLPAGETGPQAAELMSVGLQDRVMVHTLGNVMSSDGTTHTIHMKDPAIWDKIAELAEKDPSREVRRIAAALLERRGQTGK